MVNSSEPVAADRLRRITQLVWIYVVIVAATLIALIVLSNVAPKQATSEAWGHAVIVAVFAVLLPLRWRVARRGDVRARTAVGIIAGVLAVVNIVEAAIPSLFPSWMRVEMILIALLMVVVAFLAFRARRGDRAIAN